jgi:Peptidase inhibitor I78 family
MMQFKFDVRPLAILALLLTSSCNSWFDYAPKATLPNSDGATNSQSCPAKDLQYLVGKPRTALEVIRFGSTVRIEEPEQMNPQDYDASRTRIVIGVDGKIARILCG